MTKTEREYKRKQFYKQKQNEKHRVSIEKQYLKPVYIHSRIEFNKPNEQRERRRTQTKARKK